MVTRANQIPSDHRIYPWIAAIAVLIMLARSGSIVGVFNHTFDEQYHLGAAMGLYEAHKLVDDMTHPPLPWLVAGLPLKLSGVQVPELRHTTMVLNLAHSQAIGAKVLFDQQLPYWSVLIRARLIMLVFPVIALFYLYKLGSWLINPLVAMCAVIFFSTDPTLLGHGALVNNDVANAAGFLAAFYYGLRWIASPSSRAAVIAGIAFGAGMGIKFTAILIVPILVIVVLMRRKALSRKRPKMRQILAWGLAAFVTLWAIFLFDYGPIADQEFFNYTAKWQEIPAALRQINLPMPTFFLGILFQTLHDMHGHPTFFNGRLTANGAPLYFPETLAIKEPIAFVIGFVLAIGAWLIQLLRRNATQRSAIILIPIALFMFTAIAGNIQIGIRHLLPIIPLIYLFICYMLARKWRGIALAILIPLAFVETIAQHPDYLAFFNVAVPRPTDRFLVDSNLDWGQDAARLADWLHTEPNRGRIYSVRLFALDPERLLTALQLDPQAETRPIQGLFAISKSVRAGLLDADVTADGSLVFNPPNYEWLKNYPIKLTIGKSIDVYDLPATEAAHHSSPPPPSSSSPP